MQFSRYLYERKEVEASFINTLLKKETNQAIFWITEFFLSGWQQEAIDLLWSVYYDFYYVYNSTLERKLFNLLKVGPTSAINTTRSTLKSILIATNTLLSLKHSTHTFELHLIIDNYPGIDINIVYKKLPKTYNKYKNKHFVRSVERGHIVNVAHHFQSSQPLESLNEDIKTMLNVANIPRTHTCVHTHKHMYIAKISKLMLLKQKKSIKVTRSVLSEIGPIQEKTMVEEIQEETIKPYGVLSKKRKYAIDSDVGMNHFSLPRFNMVHSEPETVNLVKYNMYFHWEYYAFDTPVWRERFDRYKAFQNHETNEVEFPTEVEAEKFYQTYAYDPDEQSSETDEKSTKKIESIQYDVWFSRVLQRTNQ
jgi:hypothetical protein